MSLGGYTKFLASYAVAIVTANGRPTRNANSAIATFPSAH